MRKANNLTTFMYRFSRNSGSLNLLGPSGTVQISNGKALRFADFSYSFTHCTGEAIKFFIEVSVLVISAIEDS